MPYKSRNESTELIILKSLNTRMVLSTIDKQHYLNLRKGYEGELQFDSMTEILENECFILNDLLLKLNSTMFQIDSLIISSETIYFFEVKNYEGNYYYDSNKLYKRPQSEINNPLIQLYRSESLLRQLLQNIGFNIPISASVVFIHPEFTLYQTPLDKPFIFQTQINNFFKKINTTSSRSNKKHKMLADQLISQHILDSPYKHLPAYDYDHLRKGITCVQCSSFSIFVEGNKCVCKVCGYEEVVETAIMRSTKEFKLLFPTQKVTTNVIHDWCKVVKSKKRISRILGKNLKIIGVHQWAYYE